MEELSSSAGSILLCRIIPNNQLILFTKFTRLHVAILDSHFGWRKMAFSMQYNRRYFPYRFCIAQLKFEYKYFPADPNMSDAPAEVPAAEVPAAEVPAGEEGAPAEA